MSYSHQQPTHKYTTDAELERIYGKRLVHNDFQSDSITGNFEKTARVLDNPVLESFSRNHIVDVKLPGIGPQKDKTVTVQFNRKLAHLLLAAFEKIRSENLPYTIYQVGGYFFRYQQNPSVREALENRPEYVDLRKDKGFSANWNIVCAERDRQLKTFDERIPYGSKTKAKKDLLSNHAFGSAIDINWETNPYKKGALFDLHPRIVAILEGFGFSWGGKYHDYMHFEYLRGTIEGVPDEDPPQVFYPFSAEQRRESPLKYYYLNERGKGGYFPVGLQQNLHGGVHLEPEATATRTPVRAAMPGYIVAARLMAPGKGGDNPDVRRVTDDRPLGFVLLRHEVLDKSSNGATGGQAAPSEGSAPPAHPLYSLYMHLAAPQWDAATPDPAEAPWLASLLKMRFGGVVDLDASSKDVGKTFWSKEALSPGATAFKVHDREAPLSAQRGSKILALGKPSPEDVRQAIEALQEGAVITFDRALFPVAAGETIGFVSGNQPLEGQAPAASAGTGGARYLHWEMFSPSTQNGVIELLRAQAGIDKLFNPVKELRQNNLLDMPSAENEGASNELQQILGNTGEPLAEQLQSDTYGSILLEHFNEGKTFFPEQPDSAPRFTYPLDITLDNTYQYKGDATGHCSLDVTYFKGNVSLKTEKIRFKPGQGKLTLNVPAEADTLDLWSPDFFLDKPDPSANENPRPKRLENRIELFGKAVTRHWRNLLLDHLNEWTPESLETQLEARSEAGHLEDIVDTSSPTVFAAWKKNIRPLSWWSRKKNEDDPYGEVPVLGAEAQEQSIFGSGEQLLPESANTLNVHPVTTLWLIDILLEKETIAFKKAWPPATLKRSESTQKPPFLGFLHKEVKPTVGMELVGILVQHGYATTDGANATDVSFSAAPEGEGAPTSAPQTLGRTAYRDGVAMVRTLFPFWGSWRMQATDGVGQPFEPLQTAGMTLQTDRPELEGQTLVLGTGKTAPASDGKVRPLVSGSLNFSKNWPIALAGYVVLEHWRAPKGSKPNLEEPPTSGAWAIPVIANRPPLKKVDRGLKYEGDFIVGKEKEKNNPRVTADFTFQDFVKHRQFGQVFAGEAANFKLAFPLAHRLQELKTACRPRTQREKPIVPLVKRLSVNGLTLHVSTASGAEPELAFLEERLAQLPASPLFSVERVPEKAAISITYLEPESAGPLFFDFDPGPALGLIAAEAFSAEGETLHVRPRFIAPNGGHLVLADKESPVGDVTKLLTASLEDIKSACGNDFLEAVADKLLPPVGRFEFGEVSLKMGRGKLYTTVRLHGDAKQWTAAAPIIKLKLGGETFQQGKLVGSTVSAEWDLFKDKKGKPLPGRWGGTLEFSAEISQPDKVTTPPPGISWTVELKPRLEELKHEIGAKSIRFLGQASHVPTDVSLHITCERKDETGQWQEDIGITQLIRYKIQASQQSSHYGCCTDTGGFEANVLKSALKKTPGTFRFVWAPKGTRAGDTVDVQGIPVEVRTAPEINPEDLGA
ncbi:M15 family metallopeptidase [Cystobacter ferrugineus]|uniref:Peptidase M15C domain-containing protein n=1 Tax=Cystobacter ferrugineus TaxID=83449 RepID=A0A1L9AW93_9BACT|nr:M15 family metallopeptidase [Cystobacter ferrugineus]OJH34193.1 hypothetical protein BON30_44530 [Cystobacter ferrugineus]